MADSSSLVISPTRVQDKQDTKSLIYWRTKPCQPFFQQNGKAMMAEWLYLLISWLLAVDLL
jgi:hypothetical protein